MCQYIIKRCDADAIYGWKAQNKKTGWSKAGLFVFYLIGNLPHALHGV